MSTAMAPPKRHKKRGRGHSLGPGAPLENHNAEVLHGIRGFLTNARLPAGCKFIERQLGTLRRSLEAAVYDQHGEVTLMASALIQSVCRHEGRAQLLQRWLSRPDAKMRVAKTESTTERKTDGGTTVKATIETVEGLTIEQRITIQNAIGTATTARDKAMHDLGLDVKSADEPFDFDLPPLVANDAIEAPQTALEHDAATNETSKPSEPPTAADEPAEPLDIRSPLEEDRREPSQ